MHKFKLGQRVRVISKLGLATTTANRDYVYIGAIFAIDRISDEGTRYRQDIDYTWCDEQDLEVVCTTIHTRKPR